MNDKKEKAIQDIQYMIAKCEFIHQSLISLNLLIKESGSEEITEEVLKDYKIYLNRISVSLSAMDMAKPGIFDSIREYFENKNVTKDIQHHFS